MQIIEIWHKITSNYGTSIELKAELHKRMYETLGGTIIKHRYLDIGAGNGAIALTIGKEFDEIYGLDVAFWKYGDETYNPDLKTSGMQCVMGTANNLPFADESFDLISIISVIEHVPVSQQKNAIIESLRVLREGGELLLHLPNRYFPICLHSSLPNPIFLPKKMRIHLLNAIGYEWLLDVDIPTVKTIKTWLKTNSDALVKLKPVVWPEELVPPNLRWLYRIGKHIGIFIIFPFGYMLVVEKHRF